ncbi:hypothetical protein [Haloarchaeobius sp. TZWSO28]|uniref:hypothetical protein n=1 Tax=Haloarchaeobius sp. TZWSO28 TaxID=3446119 RepID=UPI003EB86343
MYADLDAFRQRVDEFFVDRAVERVQAEVSSLPFDRTTVREAILGNARGQLFRVDVDDIAGALTDAGYVPVETDGELAVYEKEIKNRRRQVAYRGSLVVTASVSESDQFVDATQRVITGDDPGYVADRPALATLLDVLPAADFAEFTGTGAGTAGVFETKAAAAGFAWTLGPETTECTVAFVLPSGSDPQPSALETVLDEATGLPEYEWEKPTTRGQVVSATGAIATDEFDLRHPDGPDGWPQVRFEHECDPASETVTVTHAGHDPIPTDKLAVKVGARSAALEDALVDLSFSKETLRTGDQFVVDVTNQDHSDGIYLYYVEDEKYRLIWRIPLSCLE